MFLFYSLSLFMTLQFFSLFYFLESSLSAVPGVAILSLVPLFIQSAVCNCSYSAIFTSNTE